MPRILVLDDSENVLEMTQLLLGDVHEISTAMSWSSAFKDLTTKSFDLILLDVALPGLQGNEIANILSTTFDSGDMPKIILFSAMEKTALRTLSEQCRVNGYLVKDFSNVETLKRQINQFIES